MRRCDSVNEENTPHLNPLPQGERKGNRNANGAHRMVSCLGSKSDTGLPLPSGERAGVRVFETASLRRNENGWRGLLGLAVAALLAATPVFGLDVRETLWGFDGQVVPERFNVLSVLVANPSSRPFDGTLRLLKGIGLEQGVGADYVIPCYVSPGGERWVQFYPYVSGESQWRLTWGRRPTETMELRAPSLGPPARVLLCSAESLQGTRSLFRAFPDHLFPSSVAAADGLDSVLLDYAPPWEPVKRTAFLDWLRRGGTLHLFRGAGGLPPVFSAELAALNVSQDRTPFGAGWIVRHAETRGEITEQRLDGDGFSAPRLEKGRNVIVWRFADALFPALAGFARPIHRWWLINALTLCYIAAVGPGIYWMARWNRNYRLVLLTLLGCVAAFGGLFAFVGRRGSGEQGAVHSLSCARALGDGQYQVTQWINVFATRGADYTLTHGAAHNLYAVVQDYERVNGEILGGKDGRFTVDIPFCSQRSFVHQGRMAGPALGLGVAAPPLGAFFSSTVLTVGPDFPAKPVAAWALYQDTLWPMHLRDGRLVPEGKAESVTNFLSRQSVPGYNAGTGGAVDEAAKKAAFLQLAPYVVAWSLGGTEQFQHYVKEPWAADRLRLFVMAESPDSFRLRGTPVGPETGYTVYDTDVLLTPNGKDYHE